MKCISVKDPWAALIASGRKRIELRTWRTQYRGPLIIVSGAARSTTADARRWDAVTGCPSRAVAVVELTDIREATVRDAHSACCPVDVWHQYAWKLRLIARLDIDLHVKGKLSIFAPSDDLREALTSLGFRMP